MADRKKWIESEWTAVRRDIKNRAVDSVLEDQSTYNRGGIVKAAVHDGDQWRIAHVRRAELFVDGARNFGMLISFADHEFLVFDGRVFEEDM